MLDSESESRQDEDVLEVDFSLPLREFSENLIKRHEKIGKWIKLTKEDELLWYIFLTVGALVDPFTQPEESDDFILSVDSISSLLIAIAYPKYVDLEYVKHFDGGRAEAEGKEEEIDINSCKFGMSMRFFELLLLVNRAINADDELKLRYVDNEGDWVSKLLEWVPSPGLNDSELRIVYSIVCILVVSIHKMVSPKSCQGNLSKNPYLQYFIKLWKCHTNIIILALEIDRKVEAENEHEDDQFEIPEIVYQTVNGSSAIRFVLGSILNQNLSLLLKEKLPVSHSEDTDLEDDLKNETLLNFIQPLGRKKVNGGALLIDMRLVVIALLIVKCGITFTSTIKATDKPDSSEEEKKRIIAQNTPISEIGDLLIDLEYDDRFEEDIRYMFDYGFDNTDDEWLDIIEKEEDSGEPEAKKTHTPAEESVVTTAVRSKDTSTINFDEFGRDWRDVPRDENAFFQDWFLLCVKNFKKLDKKEDSDDFFGKWEELVETLRFLKTNSIEDELVTESRIGQALLNTIAKAIKDEADGVKNDITPDKFYEFLSSVAPDDAIQTTLNKNKLIVPIFQITNAEIFLHNNNKLARCVFDELFMCKGYRRVLIWFLTHNINLSTLLIDYVFELLSGLRGSDERQRPYKFSRKGGQILLSDVERLMLLHEFLSNCSLYLSATEGIHMDDGYKIVLAESIAKKYLSLICLMINQLIKIGVITLGAKNKGNKDDDIDDYSNDIQVLLISWIGKLPEARELFFKIKTANYDIERPPSHDDVTPMVHYDSEDLANLIDKFSLLSTSEITDDLYKNPDHLSIIGNLGMRIEHHIKLIISGYSNAAKVTELTLLEGEHISSDFKFFLNHFDTLCKIEYLAETLFEKLDALLTAGLETDLPGLGATSTSEFNDQFLNGEVKFTNSGK
ncbi:uncharacterized protein PRCAT00005578001 [Priceomyces carsonii]|uniref:uncharacterized protein n=1 Tax=Priceomyces carsonii TaxID=28549 RepID=UPI002ED90977|nr:unnamed protein product [Priceomyces carsonii]